MQASHEEKTCQFLPPALCPFTSGHPFVSAMPNTVLLLVTLDRETPAPNLRSVDLLAKREINVTQKKKMSATSAILSSQYV